MDAQAFHEIEEQLVGGVTTTTVTTTVVEPEGNNEEVYPEPAPAQVSMGGWGFPKSFRRAQPPTAQPPTTPQWAEEAATQDEDLPEDAQPVEEMRPISEQQIIVDEINPLSELQIAELVSVCIAKVPAPIIRLILSACIAYTAIAIIPLIIPALGKDNFPLFQIVLIVSQVISIYSLERVRFLTAYTKRDFAAFDMPLISVSQYSAILALALAAGNKPIAATASALTAYSMGYIFLLIQLKGWSHLRKCWKAMASVDCAIGVLISALFQ